MAKQDIPVRQLVDKVSSGELTLPEMQRRYVWTGVKVRDLLDSLYRGYPSGTILVWETDQISNDRSLQLSSVKKSEYSSKLLLLDGQQRLTSLSAIISGDPVSVRGKQKPIDILFNLEHPENIWDELTQVDEEDDNEEDEDEDEPDESEILEELRKRTFVVASRSLKNDPTWVPVTDIFKKSDSQILKGLGINSEDPKWDRYSERIKNVRKIEDYIYVMQILDRKLSYEEVTEIFVRVNSLGMKLRGSDLALAQITSRWKGFMKELEDYAAQFPGNEDYLHETGIMIKALVAFATKQSKFKTVGRVPLDDFKTAWRKTCSGLRFAINFLDQNIRIQNLSLLSSPFLLIPIAVYASLKNEKLTKKEEKRLLLWFYVAHMKGRYGRGSSEGLLDSDLSALNSDKGLDGLIDNIKLQVKDLQASVEELKGKSRRSPYFSMLFFIFKQRQVKDWENGLAISEKTNGRTHALQFHHIFPKSLLKIQNYDRRDINDIANLAFIGARTNKSITNKQPSDYLKSIIEKRGIDSITTQLIPDDKNLWEMDNYPLFLESRRRAIVNEINQFLEQYS